MLARGEKGRCTVIRFRILNEEEAARAEYDGTPPTLLIRYAGKPCRAVLEQRVETEALVAWEPVEVEETIK